MQRFLTAPFVQNKTPVPFSSRRVGSTNWWNRNTPAKEQIATYDVNTTVHAIVSKTALDVSLTDWHLYRKQTDQRRNYGPAQDTRVEILPERHQASKVWAKPNPFFTQQEFVESFMQHQELTGEAYWVIEYVGSVPIAMWVVTPERMEPVPDPDDYLAGWIYTGPDGEKVPLELNQVIQIRVPNPANALRGSTPLTSAAPDIMAGRQAAEYNNRFYQNGAVPGGVIEAPGEVNDREFDRILLQWRERHQGVNNAHRVAILENGMTFNSVSPSQKDQQYIQQRELSRETVREAWTFPKPMLGATDDVNRANAEAAEYVYAKWYVEPRLKRIRQALNNDFLPLFGSTSAGVEFDYDCPVPEDLDREAAERQSKAQAFQTYVNSGVDPEDAAMICGLPPMRMKEVANSDEAFGSGDDEAAGDESQDDNAA